MSTLYVADKHVHMGFVAFRRRLDKSNCTRRLKPKGTRGPCRKTRYRTLTATCCRVFHGYQAERCLAGGSISVEAHKDVIILTALSRPHSAFIAERYRFRNSANRIVRSVYITLKISREIPPPPRYILMYLSCRRCESSFQV